MVLLAIENVFIIDVSLAFEKGATKLLFYSKHPSKITLTYNSHVTEYRKGQDSCHVLSCVHMYAYHTRPVQCKNGEDHWFVFINRHAIIILQNRKSLLGRTLSISIIRSLSMSKLQHVSVLFDMFF